MVGVNARVAVFHDIYWEEEWEELAGLFKGLADDGHARELVAGHLSARGCCP